LNRLLDPISLDDESITIGVSMGVAFCPFDADDADSLEKAADDALLSAKQAGKNRYHFVRGIRLVEEALAASGF
jgi:PleD family two-component response regulator